MSVVQKKFIGQIQLYGNLPYKCSIQRKRQIQLVVRDRMNSICPMNFFRTTDTTDTTDTTIWKPGFKPNDCTMKSNKFNSFNLGSPYYCEIYCLNQGNSIPFQARLESPWIPGHFKGFMFFCGKKLLLSIRFLFWLHVKIKTWFSVTNLFI